MEYVIALYLILVDKPRVSEENLVMKFNDLAICQSHAEALNELYKENSKYDNKRYICGPYSNSKDI
jgi:hypothetical protein